MNEERNDWTIGNLPTLGPDGPVPEAEPRETGTEWQQDAGQTIGEMETIAPEKGPGAMLLAKRYRALRRLGEGGMGSVWLAEDTKLDNRLVAIKMLPAVLAGKKGAYRQVKQEALMAMKLSHPNIATVRAFEEDEGEAPFLVMDYIEGEGLDDILSEKGPLGEEETLKLLGPVATALDYAHSQGVVHRDVKPGNVMVRKDGTPFVLDFGIAREIQETMTRVTGKFSSGTLLYMSPEQLRGRAPKAAQDVYSFAAMAYECLAGHPPFYRGAVEDQIKNEPPEKLEEGMATAGVRMGIMAGLAKVPEGRPGSCMGVLEMAAGGTACPEGSPHQRPTARPLPDADAATAGRGDENVFLRKVRVGRTLDEAWREDATAEEKAELERNSGLRFQVGLLTGVVLDMLALSGVYVLAYYIRFGVVLSETNQRDLQIFVASWQLLFLLLFRVYRRRWRFTRLADLPQFIAAFLVSGGGLVLFRALSPSFARSFPIPYSVITLTTLLGLGSVLTLRVLSRWKVLVLRGI